MAPRWRMQRTCTNRAVGDGRIGTTADDEPAGQGLNGSEGAQAGSRPGSLRIRRLGVRVPPGALVRDDVFPWDGPEPFSPAYRSSVGTRKRRGEPARYAGRTRSPRSMQTGPPFPTALAPRRKTGWSSWKDSTPSGRRCQLEWAPLSASRTSEPATKGTTWSTSPRDQGGRSRARNWNSHIGAGVSSRQHSLGHWMPSASRDD